MCKYCEQGWMVGTFHAIRAGRTFSGSQWISGDKLMTLVVDEDAGMGDADYTFSTDIRINCCPICGEHLGCE